jgi:hypothetical protein
LVVPCPQYFLHVRTTDRLPVDLGYLGVRFLLEDLLSVFFLGSHSHNN